MRAASISSFVVRSNQHRFDCAPYLSGAMEARLSIAGSGLATARLADVCRRIHNGPQFSRTYVDSRDIGVRFITAGSMLLSDLEALPLLSKVDAQSPALKSLEVSSGTTLVTCSGTVGRIGYVRRSMEGVWSSQDLLKVIPDESVIPCGYLHAFLRGRFGVPQVVAGTYGAIIRHLEPSHIFDLLVPRLSDSLERRIHALIVEAGELRTTGEEQVRLATSTILEQAGIDDFSDEGWRSSDSRLGFATVVSPKSFRAYNYDARTASAISRLRNGQFWTLGGLCEGGLLRTGTRFKRVDNSEGRGVMLISQKEAFWTNPDGRVLVRSTLPSDSFLEPDTVIVAAKGTLGESEVFCRAEYVDSDCSERFAFSEDFVRIKTSAGSAVSGAYIFAFMRSRLAFRILRSMSVGSKQQRLLLSMLKSFPIPKVDRETIAIVENLVFSAYQARARARALEEVATKEVELAITRKIERSKPFE